VCSKVNVISDIVCNDVASGVPRNFVRVEGGGGSTNSVQDRGQRERGLGAVAPSQGFWRQL